MGKLIQNYSLQMELGSGVYSRVYKAIHVVTKQEVAIKMVKADKFKELPKLQEGTINQINTLSSLQPCLNIIRYYDMLKTVNNFYFVYEYCNGGTLEKLLKKSGPLGEKQSLLYFKQLTNAFKVLSENSIMHRDIKPENILIHDGILKVADFGFCKPLQDREGMAETMLGSPIYMAPEVLKGEMYTIKADIWSLGVVLYRMIFGICPFESNNIAKLILILNQNDLRIPKNVVSHTLEQLLRRMLTKDPKIRADWQEIFKYEINDFGEMLNPYKSHTMTGSATTTHSVNSGSSNSVYNNYRSQNNKDSSQRILKRVESPHYCEQKTPSSGYRNQGGKKNTSRDDSLNPRETLKSDSPLRLTIHNRYSKKEVNIKSHKKCVEIAQMGKEVASYGSVQAILVAYILSKSVEKELLLLKESVKKDFFPAVSSGPGKETDDSFIYDFGGIVNEELKQIAIIHKIYESLLLEAGFCVEQVLDHRKMSLKKFILSIQNIEQKEQLSLCHQLMDFILQDILINKKTYEKMNSDQMLKKIRDKVEEITF